ncbi:MAG: energy transducer TonB, partial [Bacteroidaceae bacterium]|nr:energy transducer TonB [Bacteroidaceae bacterium]
AEVVKGIHELLDAEAMRVISAMPKWKPGKHRGKAVRVKYTIPLNFRLDGTQYRKSPKVLLKK